MHIIKFFNKWTIVVMMMALFMPVLINILVIIPSPSILSVGDASNWLGFFGSYLGGIIGGLVAFFIARIQIKSQKESEDYNKFISQLPTLVRLDIELERLNKYLFSLHNLTKPGKLPLGLSFEEFSLGHIQDAEELNEFHWNNIDRIIDIKLMKDIIVFKDFYLNLYKIVTINRNEIASEINNIDIRIQRLSNRKNQTKEQQQELNDLITKKMPLVNKFNVLSTNKTTLWKEIKKENFLERSNRLHKNVKDLITKIEEQLSKKE